MKQHPSFPIPFPARLLAAAVGLALCDLAAQHPAMAQAAATSAAPAAAAAAATTVPAAPGAVKSVTVVGERPVGRIDRQVYDVKGDVNASNGTAADALNNVPSVAVDPDGTVSLRGNTNVQILVDGKPSAMLQGEARGSVLQAMPGEDIDSVEVINNPGAEFGNEGGGGPILNLVMKRTRRAGGFGVANVNKGTDGRYNAALNGSYNTGRWGMQGGVNFRHDGRNSTGETTRERVDPATGAVQSSSQTSIGTGLNDSAGLRGQLTYNIGDNDTVEGSVGYLKRSNDQVGEARYRLSDGVGTPLSDYVRSTVRGGDNRSAQWGARWDHKGERLGESFKMDLRVSTNDNGNDSRFANRYLVAPPPPARLLGDSLQDVATHNRIVDFTGDYERPFDDGSILKVGYKLADTESSFDTRYLDILAGEEVVNARRTNAFSVHERDAALYASYQWKLTERWTAQGGLRVEHTDMDLDQLTTGMSDANRYLEWIPSAYATYKLGDRGTVRIAYAHRIRRPTGSQLNPFVVYQDELNESSGNPRLQPVQTDSLEIGYETKVGKLDGALRGFYRTDTDTIRSRQYVASNQVLLTTLENGGSNRSGGTEFTLSGKVTPKFSVNLSGTLALSEQQQIDLNGQETKRSASSLSVRGRFNYDLTDADHLQAQVNARGKTLAGSGYSQPVSSLNLSYRRNLTPALSLLVTVTDVFRSQKTETVTDTALLRERTLRRFDGQVAYVGLSYRFGGVQGGANRRREGPDGEGWRGGPGMPGAGGPGGPGGFGGGPGM